MSEENKGDKDKTGSIAKPLFVTELALKQAELMDKITSPMFTVLKKSEETTKTLKNTEKLTAPALPFQNILEWNRRINEFANDFTKQENDLKQYWLYNLTVEELKETELQLIAKTKELEDLKNDFRKFYEKTIPTKKDAVINKKTYYSFNCGYSKMQLKRLYDRFLKDFFDCEISNIVNLFSENITTEIHMKDNAKLIDLVAFFSALQSEKIIESPRWANTIEKTQSIFFKGKAMTANQIKDAKKQLKYSLKETVFKELIDKERNI